MECESQEGSVGGILEQGYAKHGDQMNKQQLCIYNELIQYQSKQNIYRTQPDKHVWSLHSHSQLAMVNLS
jgi:hypothetical protein